jgi:hypothetical protein
VSAQATFKNRGFYEIARKENVLRTADSRQQITDSRQQTADSRQQTADSRENILRKVLFSAR